MTEIGKFVFYRTYSRWIEKEKRRETFKEAIRRAVEYNVGIGVKEMALKYRNDDIEYWKKEAENLFDNIFNLKQFLSGRTHWVGGADTKIAEKFPLSNFNCAFTNVEKWNDLGELFYLLLIGTGVGFKCTKEMAKKIHPVRRDYKIIHAEFEPMPKEERIENTLVTDLNNGFLKIYIGDSKEGWVDGLKFFFQIITLSEYDHVKTIKISYNSIRPKGERLKTFGGMASGYESLKEMFVGIDNVLKNNIDKDLADLELCHRENDIEYFSVRPIHILDIGNLIGNNVVVGGVRRTAEIFLCDPDDWEVILAKYGINGLWKEDSQKRHEDTGNALELLGVKPKWWDEYEFYNADARPLHHRRMSNNSIAFNEKPKKELLDLIFRLIEDNGEPAFVNLEEANRRRPNCQGFNPCVEILLDNKGVCNLTTLNVLSFVNLETKKIGKSILEAQKMSVRAGMRMTCLNMEMENWDTVQKRDRLIGVSLTGWKDAMGAIDATEEDEKRIAEVLKEVAIQESIEYAKKLRIPQPLLVTTVKPEGTLSQVAGGVSSGLHVSHAPFFIRRIRINAEDALSKVCKELGWNINPEVGTDGKDYEEKMQNARTIVIDFPVKSFAKQTRNNITLQDQFDTYFMFQNVYTEQNSSNTIYVRKDEWQKACDIVYNNWDNFVGVSFLEYDGGSYQLMPYEEITEEEYNNLKDNMQLFSYELLAKYENGNLDELEGAENCESGACPIR